MDYLPHTEADRAAMLAAIGVARLENLFADLPSRLRFPDLALPAGVTELELEALLRRRAAANVATDAASCFLGAGAYNHWSPPTVDYVLQRGELYTAYTPYQPEISQGNLQAMFEYQTMICRLTGMEVSNASHYDGATALAEAVLLALDQTQAHGRGARDRVLVSSGVHPQYREVLRTYLRGTDATVVGDDVDLELPALAERLDTSTAALVIQNPNFLGQFETVAGLADAAHRAGALLIVVADPIALGRFTPPGAYGADVVVAEGQALGIPLSFGGPHLGIFATKLAHVRRLAGRLVGETVDADGARGYVLTLATREQHIRRAKATSNICTNAALVALGTAVYLATMGRSGLREVAELCWQRSHYAARAIARLPGVRVNPQAPAKPFFKEFVVALPKSVAAVNAILRDDFGIVGGYDLGQALPGRERDMLVAVTEMNDRAAIDRLVAGLAKAIA